MSDEPLNSAELDAFAKTMNAVLQAARNYGSAKRQSADAPADESLREAEAKWRELVLQRSTVFFAALSELGGDINGWRIGVTSPDGKRKLLVGLVR